LTNFSKPYSKGELGTHSLTGKSVGWAVGEWFEARTGTHDSVNINLRTILWCW